MSDSLRPSGLEPARAPGSVEFSRQQSWSGFLLGSSPGGSRVIRRGDGVGILGRNLFNYRYIERLETDSVVGKLVEKKRLNNLVYVGY